MDAILVITVLTAAILAAIALVALTLVTAAIHSEERLLNLSAQPATPAQALARKILGVSWPSASARPPPAASSPPGTQT
jgi:hypothetical protein